MTGQDAVNAAQTFNDWLDIDGVMLSKLDGDARGGAALSVKRRHRKAHQVRRHRAKSSIRSSRSTPAVWPSRILGMGDVLTLIEKAEAAFDAKKAAELEQKLQVQQASPFADFYDQLVQLKGMGSLQDLAGMMPGMNAGALKNAQLDEKAMARTEAIIQSMTPFEREKPVGAQPQPQTPHCRGRGREGRADQPAS